MFEPLEIWLVIAAPFVGSFVSQAALVWPSGVGALMGRSRCDQCAKLPHTHQLVPIWSYVRVGGRAECCGRDIPRVHLAVELLALLVAATATTALATPASIAFSLVGWVLLYAGLVDRRLQRLPDVATLGLVATGVAYALIPGGLTFSSSSLGAALGFASRWFVRWNFFQVRGVDGLGLGDAKLFAAGGAWLGAYLLPHVLAGAALITLGALLLERHKGVKIRIVFGPALGICIFIALIVANTPQR